MKPSEILSDEIDLIYGMLDVLEVMCDRMEQQEYIKIKDLKQVMNFFKVFVHMSHNRKETAILFPELKQCGNSQNETIFQDILSENQLAEMYLYALMNFLAEVQKGNFISKEKMLGVMRKYLKLERSHIQKEQLFVIPLCMQEIPEERKALLADEFILSDDTEFGNGMHQKFHDSFEKVMKSLQEKYVNN